MMASAQRSFPVEPEVYVWAFPGSPVQVRLSLAVVGAIQAALLTDRAAAGLLLGRRAGTATEIDGFDLLPGGLDVATVASEVAALSHRDSRMRPIGFFRAEAALRLSPADQALAVRMFSEPHCVFMLAQPPDPGMPGAPANATFFFWDGEALNADFPLLEFPLDVGLLASAARSRLELRQHKAVPPPAVEDAPPAAPAPAPQGRGLPRTAAWALGTAAFLAIAAGLAYLAAGRLGEFHAPAAPSPTLAGRPSFTLSAERQNADLKLTWNRDSEWVANADSAVLAIRDGDVHRQVALRGDQVRAGSVLYSPITDQVEMELAVSAAGRTVQESVTVLLPRTGAPQVTPGPRTASAAAQERAPARPVRPFTPPAPRQHAVDSPALDSPPVLPVRSASAPPTGFASRTEAPPPVPPAPAVQAPAPQSAQVRRTAQYAPPEPLRKVQPVLSSAVMAFVTSETVVQVRVSIDEAGRVSNAVFIPQRGVNNALAMAAVNAARQWTFRPARRDSQNVPGEMLIQFRFTAVR